MADGEGRGQRFYSALRASVSLRKRRKFSVRLFRVNSVSRIKSLLYERMRFRAPGSVRNRCKLLGR